MNNLKIPYISAELLIKEADILLFRAPKQWWKAGYWISKFTASPYSHVALAHWDKDRLWCVEFREFIGSRCEYLSCRLEEGHKIDVYRVDVEINRPVIESIQTFGGKIAYRHSIKITNFTEDKARCITLEAKKLIGRKYGWSVIWSIVKTFIPGLRIWIDKGIESQVEAYVCSTLIARTYNKCYVDLVPFLSDYLTTPSDIARSAYLNYLFSIEKDKEIEETKMNEVKTEKITVGDGVKTLTGIWALWSKYHKQITVIAVLVGGLLGYNGETITNILNKIPTVITAPVTPDNSNLEVRVETLEKNIEENTSMIKEILVEVKKK